MGSVGGAGELPDAARHRAPVPVQRPLRAQAGRVLHQRTTGAPSTTTRPTARGSGYDRSPTGSNFNGAVLPGARASLRGHRDGAGEPDDVVPPRAVGPTAWTTGASSGTSWCCSYQTGVQYVTWMRETWDPAGAVHRRPPLRRGAGEARAARDRRRRLAGYQRELLAPRSAAGRSRSTDRSRSRSPVGGQAVRRLRRVSRVVHDPRLPGPDH